AVLSIGAWRLSRPLSARTMLRLITGTAMKAPLPPWIRLSTLVRVSTPVNNDERITIDQFELASAGQRDRATDVKYFLARPGAGKSENILIGDSSTVDDNGAGRD